ncbi:MAG: hypothetical protein ACI30A_07185 [Paludibacteraceae bacterium]
MRNQSRQLAVDKRSISGRLRQKHGNDTATTRQRELSSPRECTTFLLLLGIKRACLSLIAICLAWVATAASPTEYIAKDGHSLRGFGESRYQLGIMGEYAYNRTWGHMGNVDIRALMPINPYFEMQANVQLSSAAVYTGAAVLRPKFALPAGELFLETELLYRAVARNRQGDFCAALSVGYRMDYVSLNIGMFGRVMSSWDRDWHTTETYNIEPFNLLYRLEVFCRPQTCNWNISACIANVDDFQMERMWQPIFMLGGRYDVDNHWRVLAEAECKPTGMFHLNATLYSASVRAGFCYCF